MKDLSDWYKSSNRTPSSAILLLHPINPGGDSKVYHHMHHSCLVQRQLSSAIVLTLYLLWRSNDSVTPWIFTASYSIFISSGLCTTFECSYWSHSQSSFVSCSGLIDTLHCSSLSDSSVGKYEFLRMYVASQFRSWRCLGGFLWANVFVVTFPLVVNKMTS